RLSRRLLPGDLLHVRVPTPLSPASPGERTARGPLHRVHPRRWRQAARRPHAEERPMSLFRQVASRAPKHVEVWGDLEASNRFLRWVAIASSLFAVVAFAAAAFAIDLALYRPLAFFVAADGTATPLGRVREQSVPADVEALFVAKRFLSHYAALNS